MSKTELEFLREVVHRRVKGEPPLKIVDLFKQSGGQVNNEPFATLATLIRRGYISVADSKNYHIGAKLGDVIMITEKGAAILADYR